MEIAASARAWFASANSNRLLLAASRLSGQSTRCDVLTRLRVTWRLRIVDELPRTPSQQFDDRKVIPAEAAGRFELVTVPVGPLNADLVEDGVFSVGLHRIGEDADGDAAKTVFLHGLEGFGIF